MHKWHSTLDGVLFLCDIKEVEGRPDTTTTRGKTVRGNDKLFPASHTFSFIMGTRSRIGIQLKDNSVLSVYCHWDGYPSFNGRVLREFYDTKEKVDQLINGGNISSLHTNVGWNNETLPETGPQYYTSRGESIDDNEPELNKNQSEYLKTADNCGEEYAYLFTSAGWTCYNVRSWDDNYKQEEEIPAGSINDK